LLRQAWIGSSHLRAAPVPSTQPLLQTVVGFAVEDNGAAVETPARTWTYDGALSVVQYVPEYDASPGARG